MPALESATPTIRSSLLQLAVPLTLSLEVLQERLEKLADEMLVELKLRTDE